VVKRTGRRDLADLNLGNPIAAPARSPFFDFDHASSPRARASRPELHASLEFSAHLELAADRSLLWITHRPQELCQFPEVRRLNPLDLGDAADPAVPGQGGNEAEPQASRPSAASDRIPRLGRS
jgi:hypothetical protein